MQSRVCVRVLGGSMLWVSACRWQQLLSLHHHCCCFNPSSLTVNTLFIYSLIHLAKLLGDVGCFSPDGALTVFSITWEDEMDLQLPFLNDMIISADWYIIYTPPLSSMLLIYHYYTLMYTEASLYFYLSHTSSSSHLLLNFFLVHCFSWQLLSLCI